MFYRLFDRSIYGLWVIDKFLKNIQRLHVFAAWKKKKRFLNSILEVQYYSTLVKERGT